MQLLETSGVADAEPLAASLSRAGFRLTAVVAVVDAEAGLEVLEQPVAVAQVGRGSQRRPFLGWCGRERHSHSIGGQPRKQAALICLTRLHVCRLLLWLLLLCRSSPAAHHCSSALCCRCGGVEQV